ncbi:MAG: copper resistance protein B [Alphaproteobacteria bacterium]
MIKSLCLASLLTLACTAPAAAQDHSHHHMAAPMATAPKAGQAPATDFLADQAYDPVVMARAREVMRFEHGGMPMSKVSANLLEYQARSGEDGYRWEGEAWYGGDLHRLVFKTQGEGGTRSGLEAAEVQALYSRAIGPFTDLQVGLRQDVKPGPGQTYGALSLETTLPYWIHAQGGLYLSPRGNLLARVEGAYDLRLTQRLILQPRAELNFAAQDLPRQDTGSGLSKAELGLRLRYELHREFAPYVGVTYDRAFGRTADFARAEGMEVKSTGVVVGIRSWF